MTLEATRQRRPEGVFVLPFVIGVCYDTVVGLPQSS